MKSSFTKAVAGATKIKCAAPKSQYIEVILLATHSGDAGVAEILRLLRPQIQNPTWTIAFKALIVVHLMIREGNEETTLRYLADQGHRQLATNTFAGLHPQKSSIDLYSNYLIARAAGFKSTGIDYTRLSDPERMKKLTVDKGLLRESECMIKQISSLTKCQNFTCYELVNDVTVAAYRLLVQDLIGLFAAFNDCIINILEQFFDLSKHDAERALNLYRSYVKMTDKTIAFLEAAQQTSHLTRLTIPRVNHAPTNLIQPLDEFLKDAENYTDNGLPIHSSASSADRTQPTSATGSKPAEIPQPTSVEPGSKAGIETTADLSFDLLSIDDEPKAGTAPLTTAGQFGPANGAYPGIQPVLGFPNPAHPGMTMMATPAGLMPVMMTGQGQFNVGPMSPFGMAAHPTGMAMPGFTASQLGPPGMAGMSTGMMIPNITAAPGMIAPPQPQTQFSIPGQPTNPNLGPTQQPSTINPGSIAPIIPAMTGSSNPFRKTVSPTGTPSITGSQPSTNPFARSRTPLQSQQVPNMLAPNVGSGNASPSNIGSTLIPSITGTNPFRQSMMANPTGSKVAPLLDPTGTVQVFPRPGQAGYKSQTGTTGW